jgi:hypothetical protein
VGVAKSKATLLKLPNAVLKFLNQIGHPFFKAFQLLHHFEMPFQKIAGRVGGHDDLLQKKTMTHQGQKKTVT